jgi:hypothetical protein
MSMSSTTRQLQNLIDRAGDRERVPLALERAAPESGGGGVAVEITAAVAYNKYTVDVYGDGVYDDAGAAKSATETGKTCFIRQIAVGSTIPLGTILTASAVGEHYEADIVRWI